MVCRGPPRHDKKPRQAGIEHARRTDNRAYVGRKPSYTREQFALLGLIVAGWEQKSETPAQAGVHKDHPVRPALVHPQSRPLTDGARKSQPVVTAGLGVEVSRTIRNRKTARVRRKNRSPAGHVAAAPRRACASEAEPATAAAVRPLHAACLTIGEERRNSGSTTLLVLRTCRQRQSSQYQHCGTRCQVNFFIGRSFFMVELPEEIEM
jgi:hypothetical protein